ncbi:MAG: response regulator transcription factor [Chloroflexota bacterium]|nr:response regulator transcription factor [Chloroflexota bacterium]
MQSNVNPNIQKIRVIIVDDNFVMRAGLRSALMLEPDFEVVGEGQNGLEAVSLACDLQPDLVLMDFRMPLMDGIKATERIVANNPTMRVVITTWSEDPKTLVGAILAGAKGYLVHGRFTLPELTNAIRSVYEGGALITPSLAPVLLDLVKSKAGSGYEVDLELDSMEQTHGSSLKIVSEALLTRREREILELVQLGKSNREIADILVIEEKTVKNHINNLYSKLQVKNRQDAMSYNRKT